MIKTLIEIRNGNTPPLWYGRAYHRLDTDEIIFYPIPFNWVVGWWHKFVFFVRWGPKRNDELERMRRFAKAEYERGWVCGNNHAKKNKGGA